MKESHVHIQASLVSNCQSSELAEPSKRALYNPSVPAQSFLALHSSSGNSGNDASLPQCSPATLEVIPLVSMQFSWSFPSSSAKQPRLLDRLDSIHHISESIAVMDVSSSADYRERYSLSVDHNMALRTGFSFIRRIRAGCIAPFLARTVAESTAARDQSILPASPNLSSSTWCRRSHTPAFCHSFSLRQQVTPLPQPISCGNIFHWMPVRRTNTMPLKVSRLDILGRPPFGLMGSAGNKGSRFFQSFSDIMNLFMIEFYRNQRF